MTTSNATADATNKTATVRRSATRLLASAAAISLSLTACGESDTATQPTIETDSPPIASTTESTVSSTSDGTATTTAAVTSAATATSTATTDLPESLTLVTYESFDTTEGGPLDMALEEFTAETGIDVEILVSGDTGSMLAKASLTAGNPEGDVMWGIDNTFLSRAIEDGVFEPYEAAGLSNIPTQFTDLVPNHFATPVDFGDVCVNYDIAALEAAGVTPPETLADLLDPTYANMLVVQNPATSSPGLAFLMATIAEYGESGWQDYWAGLVDNGVRVVDGWSQAYYEDFSYYGGDRPIVISYGSSPPFEVLFAEDELDTAPTGVAADTCFRQVEFAGVLAGTEHRTAATMLIDFLISERFQREIPLNLFVFPVNANVELDPAFTDYAVIAADPYRVDSSTIEANRQAWIDEWTALVLG